MILWVLSWIPNLIPKCRATLAMVLKCYEYFQKQIYFSVSFNFPLLFLGSQHESHSTDYFSVKELRLSELLK
jgi:hypothetical protein